MSKFKRHGLKPKARIQAKADAQKEPFYGVGFGGIFYHQNKAYQLEKEIRFDFEKEEMGKQFIVSDELGQGTFFYLHHSAFQMSIFKEEQVEKLTDKEVAYPRVQPLQKIDALGEVFQLSCFLDGYRFLDLRDRAKIIRQVTYLSVSEQRQIRMVFEEKKVTYYVGFRLFEGDFSLEKNTKGAQGDENNLAYDENDLV